MKEGQVNSSFIRSYVYNASTLSLIITPLILCVRFFLLCVLSSFFSKFKFKNQKKNGVTALSWASLYGHSTCVGPLLNAGADVNSFDQVVVDGG